MAERLGKDAFSWLPPEGQLATLQVPEAVGAAAAGVLGNHMSAILEQTLAAELEEGGAADREAAAGFLGGDQSGSSMAAATAGAAWVSGRGYRKERACRYVRRLIRAQTLCKTWRTTHIHYT
jgi:hypothetical protein